MSETSEEMTAETRRELRPGLMMVKRRVRKDDGRYLIYFDFERDGSPAQEEQR